MTRTALPRSFTLLWTGSAASQVGSMNMAIGLPLLALSLSHSPVFAGWVTAARTFPTLVVYLPAGVIVDHFDRRRIIIFCHCARLIVAAILTIGLISTFNPALVLVTAAAVDGILVALCNLAENNYTRHIVPREMLAEAMARNEARTHIAHLLGRPLGGLLYGLCKSGPFIAYALLSIISTLLIYYTKPVRIISLAKGRVKPAIDFRECLSEFFNNRFLRLALIVCTTTNFIFQTIFLMLIVQTEHGYASNSLIGVLFIASGLGGTLGSITAPRLVRTKRKLRTMFICVWCWVGMVAVIWFFDQPIWGMAAWGGISFIGAHVNVALALSLATSVPARMQARVTSINGLVTSTAVPLGSLFAGYVLSVMPSSRDTSGLVLLLTLVVAFGVTAYALKRRRKQLARGVQRILRHLMLRFRSLPPRCTSESGAYHVSTDKGVDAVRRPRG